MFRRYFAGFNKIVIGINFMMIFGSAARANPLQSSSSYGHQFQKNGIKLLQNGSARQLVIFSHGGWKEIEARPFPLDRILSQKGDGFIQNYQGPRIDFYTADGGAAKGMSILDEISSRPADAFNKLDPSVPISGENIEFMAKMYGRKVEEMMSSLFATAVGCREQVFPGDTIKDYALYHNDRNEYIVQRYMEKKFHPDIDIALVSEKDHKRHLSDIIAATELSGVKYDVIHFAACRVDRNSRMLR